ncbi:acyloxyacyl hydrolase [Acidicapsa acidisoli]|uniref:acyloxyacyl hydrolase n=1 Tax=Acidicapsa acidisoli TaxID=1615681 RepID=UPI0021E0A9E2|nr:acyloxyacyl hydrolase [Acidicapsa acidisoli]
MYRFFQCTFALGLILGSGFAVAAETTGPDGSAVSASVDAVAGAPAAQSSPASGFEPLAARRWELGPFVNVGTGVAQNSSDHFFAAGFQVGRNLTPIIHAGPLSGRFEFGGNIMPLWQAYTPSPYSQMVPAGGTQITQNFGGGTFTGASITPVVFRWNFATRTPRLTPWFQAAAGVVYTSHKFPPTLEVPQGTPGGTSVFNFRSGGGFGVHYFTRPRRSVDFLLSAEHISSASLGDKNPGINASLQFQLGYTWWK